MYVSCGTQCDLKSLSLPCPSEVGHRSSLPSSMAHWLALLQGPDISRWDVYDLQSTKRILTSASSAFVHNPLPCVLHPRVARQKKKNELKHLHRVGRNFKISLANKLAPGLWGGILPRKSSLTAGAQKEVPDATSAAYVATWGVVSILWLT